MFMELYKVWSEILKIVYKSLIDFFKFLTTFFRNNLQKISESIISFPFFPIEKFESIDISKKNKIKETAA